MSKKTSKKLVNVVGTQQDEEDETADYEDQGMEAAIKDFADGERYIKLYRHPTELSGGRPRLLAPLSREDFNDVYIQERFGGGKYFGRWRKRNGQYTRFNFDIDGEPKVQTRAAEDAQREQEAREENPYGFLKRGTQQDEPEGTPDGIGTADVLRIIAETRKEAREEMRLLLEMMRPAQQAPDATEKVFSLVEKIVPLISQGGGDGSGGNPWLFALSQLKEPLSKIVETIHVAVTQPKPAPGGATMPGSLTPAIGARETGTATRPSPEPSKAPAPEPEPKNEDAMLLDSFRPYLGMLVKAAAEGKDPALYCDLILDQTPVFAYDRLRTWLVKPGCLDDLAKIEPTIYHDQGWWNALRGLLLEALTEEPSHAPRNIQSVPDSDPSAPGPADRA